MTEKHGCKSNQRAVLFDWGDTLMKVFPQYSGAMRQWPEIALMPGAAAVLDQLASTWQIALATNAVDSDEADIRAALRRGGILRYMDAVFCFGNVGFRKPSEGFYQRAAAAMNLPVSRMVMVGDSLEQDVLGARAAGLHAVWYRPAGVGGLPADVTAVADLEELPAVLEELVPEG